MTGRLDAVKGVIASTDNTFKFVEGREGPLLIGKCLMCRRKQVALSEGQWNPALTVEHIEPRHHGGGHSVRNLGLACARCNHRKGKRVDPLSLKDPSRLAAVARLLEERDKRLRLPLPDIRFGPLVVAVSVWASEDPEWMHLELQ